LFHELTISKLISPSSLLTATSRVSRAPLGPGLWPGPCRQARWGGRGSRVNGGPKARPAGILHRPAGPAEESQPEHGRRLPRHVQAAARFRARQDRQAAQQAQPRRPGRHPGRAFLQHLEEQRGNGSATRNARLAAIHSLFRYAAPRAPEHAAVISPGLTASGGLLKYAEIRARWCQPWVSAARRPVRFSFCRVHRHTSGVMGLSLN